MNEVLLSTVDPETQRVQNWTNGFYQSLEQNDADLIPLFGSRIHFFPQQDKDNSINPGLMELDERYATAEQIKRMWDVFESYAAQHRV
jgi:hypothetical protein